MNRVGEGTLKALPLMTSHSKLNYSKGRNLVRKRSSNYFVKHLKICVVQYHKLQSIQYKKKVIWQQKKSKSIEFTAKYANLPTWYTSTKKKQFVGNYKIMQV